MGATICYGVAPSTICYVIVCFMLLRHYNILHTYTICSIYSDSKNGSYINTVQYTHRFSAIVSVGLYLCA